MHRVEQQPEEAEWQQPLSKKNEDMSYEDYNKNQHENETN